jgi:hypothetical protein
MPQANPSGDRASSPKKLSLPVSSGWLVALALYYVGANVVTHYHKLAGAGAVLLGLVLFIRPLGRLLGHTLLSSWKKINEEARLARQADAPDRFDFRPLVVLTTVAVSLTLIEYYGDRDMFAVAVVRYLPSFLSHRYYELAGFAYWSGARFAGYVLIPWLVVLCIPRERMRDYGLRTKGFLQHVWIYGVLFLIVLLPVTMVSFTKAFQKIYPFYRLAARSWLDFLGWEALYALQFLALEVFFRGFMLHPLKRALGSYAIFAMAVPYCMIHYNKHLAEVLGAVAAGIVLGTLSLRTGSIWCGVLIHVSVAITMDVLALVHTVGYPGNPRLVL